MLREEGSNQTNFIFSAYATADGRSAAAVSCTVPIVITLFSVQDLSTFFEEICPWRGRTDEH